MESECRAGLVQRQASRLGHCARTHRECPWVYMHWMAHEWPHQRQVWVLHETLEKDPVSHTSELAACKANTSGSQCSRLTLLQLTHTAMF